MPCLLVDNDRLVKTVKYRKPRYIGDPVNAVRIFNEKEVDELMLLDITATTNSRPPNFSLIQSVAEECFMPLTYGGGISTKEIAEKVLRLGVEKMVIGTAATENPVLIEELAATFGSQSVVASIDVRQNCFGSYTVWSRGGRKRLRLSPVECAQRLQARGAGEIVLNSIHREGTWNGFDIKLLKLITSAVEIPVIASGGAGSLAHLEDALTSGGASAVAIGSMAVYQSKDTGVLIGFPSPEQIEQSRRGARL